VTVDDDEEEEEEEEEEEDEEDEYGDPLIIGSAFDSLDGPGRAWHLFERYARRGSGSCMNPGCTHHLVPEADLVPIAPLPPAQVTSSLSNWSWFDLPGFVGMQQVCAGYVALTYCVFVPAAQAC